MSPKVVAQNELFTVTGDSVTEGLWTATALSGTHLVSNYDPDTAVAPADSCRVVHFRLALNAQDNELLPNEWHTARLGADTTVITAGVASNDTTTAKQGSTTWTVRADLRHVLKALRSNGHYVTATGDTLKRSDFRGVWISGDVMPMTANMRTLFERQDLKMHPVKGEEGLYEISLQLQPGLPKTSYRHEWKIERPDADYPMLNSGQNLINALYNMSVQDIRHAKAGSSYAKQSSETSYSILLALAAIDPEGSKATLRQMVNGDKLKRSYDSPWAWPVTAGDVAWAMAAWETFVVTGDRDWLRWAYGVLSRTVDDDWAVMHDAGSGLMHGGVSYQFAYAQFYPDWMQPKDIFETQSLTVNVLYCRALEVLNDMSDELELDTDYGERYLEIKDAINDQLWNEQKGYYSQYTMQAAFASQAPGIDNLGQALSVLLNVADDDRAETLLMRTPTSHYGIPAVSPHYAKPGEPNMSESVSPLVQAIWNLAAAKTGNENMLRRGLGALYRAEALFCGNRQAWHAYTGKALGPADGDLGCAASNLAMVLRVYCGMTFLPGGIEFNPTIPVFLTGVKRLNGFRYRKAVIDITIEGTGNDIKSISIDGKSGTDNFISADLTGRHTVHIVMQPGHQDGQEVTVAGADYTIPPTPLVHWSTDSVSVLNYNSTLTYRLMVNGAFRTSIGDSATRRPAMATDDGLMVLNVAAIGKYSYGFLSRPYLRAGLKHTEAVSLGAADSVTVQWEAPAAGDYMMDVHYQNTALTGLCPALSVTANTHPQGIVIMPGQWLSGGRSNMVKVTLLKGPNQIVLRRVQGSGAWVDGVRLMKL